MECVCGHIWRLLVRVHVTELIASFKSIPANDNEPRTIRIILMSASSDPPERINKVSID